MLCFAVAALTLAMGAPVQTSPAQTLPAPLAAGPVAAPELTQRVADLAGALAGTVSYDGYFAPGFRAAVPAAQFAAIGAQLRAAAGAFERVESVRPTSPDSAEVALGYANGIVIAQIAVDPAAPHLVTGLRIGGLLPRAASLDAVSAALAALPGRTGFVVARLGDERPAILASKDADIPLAVGSAFKLVVLAELVRGIEAGERHWDDTVTLDGGPLPGGAFTAAPAGTAVSLRALAERMISVSDNSAADLLLKALGRAKVEAMLPMLGVADPARDRPFLATLELFKLKGVAGLADRWLALSEAGRRAMLEGEMVTVPLSAIDEARFQTKKPYQVDRIEWFFSPADLVRVLDWLKRHTEAGPAADARRILAINPGVPPTAAASWRYVGYKGGYEPGVMNMSQLLQAANGAWYVIAMCWNDPVHDIDQLRMAGLVARADQLAGR